MCFSNTEFCVFSIFVQAETKAFSSVMLGKEARSLLESPTAADTYSEEAVQRPVNCMIMVYVYSLNKG